MAHAKFIHADMDFTGISLQFLQDSASEDPNSKEPCPYSHAMHAEDP
jgi:hypothetical protein